MTIIRLGLDVPEQTAIEESFFSVLTKPLNRNFVNLTLDAVNSQLVITPRDGADSSSTSPYRGEYRWSYTKVDLDSLIPYALSLETDYPLTYRALRQQLLTRYQINIAEGEFSLTPGGAGLRNDDTVNTPLQDNYTNIQIYARPESARFRTDSSIRLTFIQPTRRVPLRALFDSSHRKDLETLKGR